MSRPSWIPLLLAAVAAGALAAGCIEHPCPDGFHKVRGGCLPNAPVDAGATDGAVDGGGTDGATDGGGGIVRCDPTGDYTEFGKSCTQQSDCACPAGTCNTGLGYICTELNCNRTDADGGVVQVCPPTWTCTDISGLPGVPPGVSSVCLPP